MQSHISSLHFCTCNSRLAFCQSASQRASWRVGQPTHQPAFCSSTHSSSWAAGRVVKPMRISEGKAEWTYASCIYFERGAATGALSRHESFIPNLVVRLAAPCMKYLTSMQVYRTRFKYSAVGVLAGICTFSLGNARTRREMHLLAGKCTSSPGNVRGLSKFTKST